MNQPAWPKLSEGAIQRQWGWQRKCPAHQDDRASLAFKIGDSGAILLKCHAGCTAESIVESLGISMHDLWPESDEPPPERRVVARYDYRDENGNVLYRAVRYEPKAFSQERLVDGAWVGKLGDVRRVPYRLPEMLESVRPVVLVEGEKAADFLAKQGILATTTSGGASGWRPEYAEFFKDRIVIIVPDNDPPGLEYAVTAATWITRHLCVRLPGAEPKWGADDWIAANGIGKFRAVVREHALARVEIAASIARALG